MAGFPQATAATFAGLTGAGSGIVIVDFFTPDCVPCRKLEPMLAAVAGENAGRMQVIRVDASTSPEIARQYAVQGVPTLVLLKDGALQDKKVGFLTAGQLRAWVGPHLG